MESTCVNLATTMSMLFAMAGPQGWADLPIELLQSIVMLLSCTRDLLAFIATCPSWRAAFMLAKPTLSKPFPPLIVQSCAHLSTNGQVHHTWQLVDPQNPTIRFHRQIPTAIMNMEFVGCSYGNAIFASIDTSRITIVDVFTSTCVSPPFCPTSFAMVEQYGYYNDMYFGLTAAMSSPKACLFVSTIHGLFVWRIGSDAWQKHIYESYHQSLPIIQIVTYKGQIIASGGACGMLFVVHLDVPQVGIILEKLPVVWENLGLGVHEPIKTWLVVCKEKLVLVASLPFREHGFSFFYLDSSTDPARWMPTPDLDHAAFVSSGYHSEVIRSVCPRRLGYGRGHVYSVSPNRWGGKRGYLHLPPDRDVVVFPFTSGRLLPSWVLPSVVMSDGTEPSPKQCNGKRDETGKEEKARSCVRRRKGNRNRKPVIRLNL